MSHQHARELAHQIVRTQPGSPEDETLQTIYSGMTPGEQLACRAELRKCRQAKRGELHAAITS